MAVAQQQSWELKRTPLFGVPTQRNTGTKDQRYVNVYLEALQNKFTGDKRFFCTKRPGLVEYMQPSGTTGVGRGIYSWNGNLYSVVGNKIYKNTTALSPTLATTTGLVSFSETSAIAPTRYLAMNDGASLYLIKTDDTVSTVSDIDYPTANNLGQVEFFDGYMVVATSTGKIQNSDLEDPTAWAATSLIQAQNYPDNLVAIARNGDTLLALGEWSTETFYNSGVAPPGSFMARLQQGSLQIGCAGKDTVAQHESFIIWVSQAKSGGCTIQKLEGISNLTKISTEPIERFLNAEEASISSAVGYLVRTAGHFFYVLTLSASNRTFVYDIGEDYWVEWQSGSSGRFTYPCAIQHLELSLIQHETDGKIYKLSPTTYQDGSTDITVIIQTAPVDYDSNRRKFYRKMEVYGDRTSSSSPISVQYSDDNYNTFSTARTIDMADRAWLTKLGQSRRRAWKFTHTANTDLRIEGMEVEYQEGSY